MLDTIKLTCKAVNLENFSPEANTELAFFLNSEFKASPVFGTVVSMSNIRKEQGVTLTFSIDYTVKLKRPLKF